MGKQKGDEAGQLVTRAEFEELSSAVNRFRRNLIELLEDRLICFEEIEAIKDQLIGRPVRAPGRLHQDLCKERGIKAWGDRSRQKASPPKPGKKK